MGQKATHLLEVHASHVTHASHAAHASHTTHATHIEVFINGCSGTFLLILIDPLAKVGLDVGAFYLREARPVFAFDIIFTKIKDESA